MTTTAQTATWSTRRRPRPRARSRRSIKERFKEWIWPDDERRERLCRLYNDTFNHTRAAHVQRRPSDAARREPGHQLHGRTRRPAVWRILQTPNTLLAHVVGAGKTYTMVAAAMELKRLGLARKPMFVVPNHMLGQFSSELLDAVSRRQHPGRHARRTSRRRTRKTLMSRIATGNWDAVIVTHSGFEKIPSRARNPGSVLQGAACASWRWPSNSSARTGESRIVKALEQAKKRLEAKLKELAANEKKDDTLTFEELGVDRLLVDEAHYFKNLFYVSKMTRIAGLPQTASQRAFDMFLKVRHVQRVERRRRRGVRHRHAHRQQRGRDVHHAAVSSRCRHLKTQNVHHFDSWAATFGEPVTAMELAPDGSGYRLNTRFARFINVPELMQMFRQVADIQTQAMLKLPVPDLRRRQAHCHQRALLAGVEARSCNRWWSGPRRCAPARWTRARTTCCWSRPTDERRRSICGCMIRVCPIIPTARSTRPWPRSNASGGRPPTERSAQLVFCDLSVPTGGKGFSVYEDMRDKLLARGVPADQIAFIQDYESDAAKLQLFRDVRAGKVRILFGSTQKMGTGTNVQERLIALHHLDAPWRPADVEQREGRILRQGNTNAEVQIYRYVTEDSFDAYLWQTLETKARFIAQVMTGETTSAASRTSTAPRSPTPRSRPSRPAIRWSSRRPALTPRSRA